MPSCPWHCHQPLAVPPLTIMPCGVAHRPSIRFTQFLKVMLGFEDELQGHPAEEDAGEAKAFQQPGQQGGHAQGQALACHGLRCSRPSNPTGGFRGCPRELQGLALEHLENSSGSPFHSRSFGLGCFRLGRNHRRVILQIL